MPRPPVVAISSHVARGSVGNRAMAFALERLGHEVWSVPTVLLAHHPGRGPGPRTAIARDTFAAMLDALGAADRFPAVGGLVSGYFADAGQVEAVARLVSALKEASPGALFVCDPVIGDSGRLYVDDSVAAAVRDRLLPLADVATPNAFECAWLAGEPGRTGDAATLAALLPCPNVVVTSVPALMRGHIGNLLSTEGDAVLAEHRAVETAVKGTGDLLAALLLARLLEGRGIVKALEMAAASVFEVVAATARAGGDEMMLAEFQTALVQPRAPVAIRRFAPRPSLKPRPLV
ncbi:pyridoxal kinase [Propylenella binzhouense]|uniref:pyridoxal kinase n=1 Tax=Propylenella binzhouense TaxID=2555902 RepID=A0A964T483_9HYPH|nr:pyridoxal kinase [Propylenella binzhouense]MYZ48173.1 pyridoxal kinase [Propylenella binzhouense]